MEQSPKIEFTITPTVSEGDIKALTRIHVDALQDDNSASVKFATKEEFAKKVEQMLRVQMDIDDGSINTQASAEGEAPHSNWLIVKATLKGANENEQDKKIIGWASWLYETIKPTGVQSQHAHKNEKEDYEAPKSKVIQFDGGLGAFVRQHQTRLYADWHQRRLKDTPMSQAVGFISLRAVFVSPHFQRQGVGAALVRYGCERADRLGLDMLVTATPMAKSVYETAGNFEAFDHLEVSLDDWADDDKFKEQNNKAQGAMGHYRFWFMARTFRKPRQNELS